MKRSRSTAQFEAATPGGETAGGGGPERAVLVKLITPRNAGEVDPRNPLGELKALAEAAGAVVTDALIQKRTSIASGTYIGKGKTEELRARAEAAPADVIIFDDDLTPAQIRSLEEATQRRVIDRSELILDIFALRARSREAQLQVEIAQLEYTAPRLRGMWTHLERVAGAAGGAGAGVVGGIGTRGPGERQIEIDRRIVKDRLAHLRREIEKIDQRKQREVQSRADELTVSLVGYTNAGKSTLMNLLTDSGQECRDQLFVTLETKTARWSLGDGQYALLSDTVGFIRNLPHRLVASFRATLEETIHADLICHIVDAAARDAMRQIEAVKGVLADLGCGDKPVLTLLNKIDVVTDEALVDVLADMCAPALRISAKSGRGVEKLIEYITAALQKRAIPVTLRVGVGDGKLATLIGRLGKVRARRYVGDHVELDVTIDRAQLEQLRSRYAGLEVVGGPVAGETPG